jgi:hypothetical protein
VTEKYRQYEELASRGGETFTPDGTRLDTGVARPA